MSISVVIPVYNAAQTLRPLMVELEPELAKLAGEFEVILVDDGSRDASATLISELAAAHPWIRPILLMRNYGQHNALLAGIRAARYDVLITMDDDLEHPPSELHHLTERLDEKTDVVYGVPQEQQHGFWRNLASWTTKVVLQSAMGAEVARQTSALRVFRTGLRTAFEGYRSPFVSIDVLLTWGTTRFAAVKVRHDSRRAGVSNYTFRKLMVHALNMMTGFSTLPLQVASFIGFSCTLFGLAVLAYVIVRYIINGGSVPGFPFLASIISIFSGAQLFSIGIIGEYLARSHFRMMDKPTYAIRPTVPHKMLATPTRATDPVAAVTPR